MALFLELPKRHDGAACMLGVEGTLQFRVKGTRGKIFRLLY
jgi:hypothetical protein